MLYIAYFVLYCILFLFGSCIGSFLNVVIFRVPLEISVAKGRSFCPGCQKTLRPLDMIPVFSYLFLRGRCHTCKMNISRRYPIVETLMGLAALFIYIRGGFTVTAGIWFVASSVLLAVAFIDFDTMIIPNGLVLALLLPAVAAAFCIDRPTLLSRVIGFLAVSLPMFLLTIAIPDSFGGGDVKLMAVCGFLLGWQNTLLAGFIALLLGGGYGVILLIRSRDNRKSHFAFGPYLCVGVFISMLYGDSIVNWYLQICGLV